jgi:hypothetical protein
MWKYMPPGSINCSFGAFWIRSRPGGDYVYREDFWRSST